MVLLEYGGCWQWFYSGMADSCDEEVRSLFPPSKRRKENVTSQQLSKSLERRWGLSESICRVLEGQYGDSIEVIWY